MKDKIDLSLMQSVPILTDNGFVRLNRYWMDPDSNLWDDIWENTDESSYWNSAIKGNLDKDYNRVITKYLSKGSKILEAGCGVGQVVLALRFKGYDCYGLDYAEKIISKLNLKFPDVPFHQGDIRALNYPNNSFDAYISLGVIEHFLIGQQNMIDEASRVTKSGGYIFISVPYLNKYRKLRIKLGLYNKENTIPDTPYFESCFTEKELINLLNKSGFIQVENVYLNTIMPFIQESFLRPLYRPIEDVRYVRGFIDKILNLVLPKKWFAHMIMIVAKKN